MTIEYPHGTPSWVDLSSPDLDASARFYGELLGWESEDVGFGYRMFTLGGARVAGLGPVQEGARPVWTTYVSVDDARAVREQVEAAGGRTLVEPMEVGDAGAMAIFADGAGGAAFGVWQPGETRGAQLVNAVGALAMNELDTRNFDAAAGFYRELFRWEVERVEPGGRLVYGQFKLDGRLVAGLLPMDAEFPAEVPDNWIPYFGVEDVDAALATVAAGGGRQMAPVLTVPNGRFAPVLDPHGAAFAVLESVAYDPPPGG